MSTDPHRTPTGTAWVWSGRYDTASHLVRTDELKPGETNKTICGRKIHVPAANVVPKDTQPNWRCAYCYRKLVQMNAREDEELET